MAKETAKKVEAKVTEPKFTREQLLTYPEFNVGERAFIGAMPEKHFPNTVEGIQRLLKGGNF